MMRIQQTITLLGFLLLTGSYLSCGRVLRTSASGSRQLQQLGYVPQGCQGLQVQVDGAYGFDANNNPIVSGTVTLSNPNTFDMPISTVKVQVSNNIPVAPLFTTANCYTDVVPSNPQPYQLGTITCSYSIALPTNGIAAGFSNWPSVMATATIGMSNAQCTSSVYYMPQQQPLLFSSAGAGADAPVTTSSSKEGLGSTASSNTGKRKLMDATMGFVPTGCQGLVVEPTGQTIPFMHKAVGSVVLKNPNTFDIPIKHVKVKLANNVALPPLSVTAHCLHHHVRPSPVPFRNGELMCEWEVALPTSGPASSAAAWISLEAVVTIDMSGATCSSKVTPLH